MKTVAPKVICVIIR